MEITESIKDTFTPTFHHNLKQVAPYIIEFDDTLMFLRSYMLEMAKVTGSTCKFLTYSKNGKTLWRVSDPLCKILEESGVNK